MRSTTIGVAIAAALLGAAIPAHAVGEGATGIAVASEGSGTRRVDGQCSFGAMLPGTSFETIGVAYDASAHATGAAVSTSVVCNLRPLPGSSISYGEIGITVPGTEAAYAGTAQVPRLVATLYACVKVNASYIDGHQASNNPLEKCAKL